MNATARRFAAALLAFGAASGCAVKVSDSEAIAAVAMAEVARTAPGQHLCVSRHIGVWEPVHTVMRIDPPAPPGFASLYNRGRTKGGVTLSGESIGGVPFAERTDCFDLRGPLIQGDRAMIEVHLPGVGLNMWERRRDGRWQLVTTTTSDYPD